MRIRISLFPKILDSTFPIASEEPGPGAFRCPGSPLPTTAAAAAAKPKRSRPAARAPVRPAWELPPRDGGPSPPLTRASPATQLDSSGRRGRRGPCVYAGRAAALLRRGAARPGPELPFPPRAPRERRYGARSSAFSSLRRGRLRPSGPPHRPASTGLTTDPGHPRQRGSGASSGH